MMEILLGLLRIDAVFCSVGGRGEVEERRDFVGGGVKGIDMGTVDTGTIVWGVAIVVVVAITPCCCLGELG
jgi:hypothetical protein